MQDLLFVDNPEEIKAASGDEQTFAAHAHRGILLSRHNAVGARCRRGLPHTWPHWAIIEGFSSYASLNCQWRKELNVILCVQHMALWLWLYIGLCFQGWTLIPDRNEEIVPLSFGGLFLSVLNNVR